MLYALPFLVAVSATQPVEPVVIRTPELTVEMMPRTPNQMMSFYEARGFPKTMLTEIKQYCFITTGITNTSDDIIWLELSEWKFIKQGETIERRHRNDWKNYWQQTDAPKSKQSTFRWTLIPESLDYLPHEREGGNITLPFTPGYFTLEATFRAGKDKQGKMIRVRTDKLYCAEDPQQ
jgi:hypothetical protein